MYFAIHLRCVEERYFMVIYFFDYYNFVFILSISIKSITI